MVKLGNSCASPKAPYGNHEPVAQTKSDGPAGQVFICKNCGCFYATDVKQVSTHEGMANFLLNLELRK